jgi:hypothetical protein
MIRGKSQSSMGRKRICCSWRSCWGIRLCSNESRISMFRWNLWARGVHREYLGLTKDLCRCYWSDTRTPRSTMHRSAWTRSTWTRLRMESYRFNFSFTGSTTEVTVLGNQGKQRAQTPFFHRTSRSVRRRQYLLHGHGQVRGQKSARRTSEP